MTLANSLNTDQARSTKPAYQSDDIPERISIYNTLILKKKSAKDKNHEILSSMQRIESGFTILYSRVPGFHCSPVLQLSIQ